jgi:hypothetical protein
MKDPLNFNKTPHSEFFSPLFLPCMFQLHHIHFFSITSQTKLSPQLFVGLCLESCWGIEHRKEYRQQLSLISTIAPFRSMCLWALQNTSLPLLSATARDSIPKLEIGFGCCQCYNFTHWIWPIVQRIFPNLGHQKFLLDGVYQHAILGQSLNYKSFYELFEISLDFGSKFLRWV